MCGICGIYRKDHDQVDKKTISSMCSTMTHRGPDDEGHYLSGNVGLGMRRLKVIDLETGNQPISNEDKSIWIVQNGEIFNYLELRDRLKEKGHHFYTRSDTEVIVHLYEEYGEECIEHLNGMFGFALWDENNKLLFLARDRLGIKPLYYYEDDDVFLFGSEIKAILNYPDIGREIDYEALSDYFSLQYIPAPETIYKGINKLPQACSITLKNNRSSLKKYWHLKYCVIPMTQEEAIESTISEIERTVQLQMISDVPLGAFLSGGLDSSILVAVMSSLSDRPVETFSVVWDRNGQAFDERKYARFVSERYNTNHHEFLVKPQVDEVAEETIKAFDEPFANDSAIPNYHIARETKKYVTVALSGLGGDELAAGYERYLGMSILKYFQLIPESLRSKVFENIIDRLPDSKNGLPWIDRVKRFGKISGLSFIDSYLSISAKMNASDKQALFTEDVSARLHGHLDPSALFRRYDLEAGDACELNRMLYIDMNTYMVDELLVLSDRMSMAHSLELRVPYLDHLLVEHFAKVDPALKLHGFTKKYLLKKIAERYYPKSFIYRKKVGFSTPLVLWLRGELKGYMLHILNRKSVMRTGIINPDAVERYVHDHLGLKRNYDMRLWALMMFMLWYNTYIDKVY